MNFSSWRNTGTDRNSNMFILSLSKNVALKSYRDLTKKNSDTQIKGLDLEPSGLSQKKWVHFLTIHTTGIQSQNSIKLAVVGKKLDNGVHIIDVSGDVLLCEQM